MHLHLDPATRPLPASTRALSGPRWAPPAHPLHNAEPLLRPQAMLPAARQRRTERIAIVVACGIAAMLVVQGGLGL